MSFISYSFALLYVVALVLRWSLGGRTALRVFALLVLSWIFYAWNEPWYIFLILASTLVDYVAALWMAATPKTIENRRRTILGFSLIANLGLLGYFKYAGFVLTALNDFSGSSLTVPNILLPVGISFYTFQSLSYTIDVYRRKIEPEREFLRLACYIAFFPQLVAGPIVRAADFLYQFNRKRRFHFQVFLFGGYLIVRGLFLKMVVADNLGQIVDRFWEQAAGEPHGTLPLAMLVFFSCQLFCDFAGYVDIARGAAYQLGFRLPINFNAPYIAASFAEFWRRWHITLSQWFRDYLYIPLGGNRRGRIRGDANLIGVMLISGLWHGANWTFVVWGGLLGLAVAIERLFGFGKNGQAIWLRLPWFLVVQLTWILSMGLFRASDLAEGSTVIRNALYGLAALPIEGLTVSGTAGLIELGWWFTLPVWLLHGRSWLAEHTRLDSPSVFERAVYAGAMLAMLLLAYSSTQQFIYFQF